MVNRHFTQTALLYTAKQIFKNLYMNVDIMQHFLDTFTRSLVKNSVFYHPYQHASMVTIWDPYTQMESFQSPQGSRQMFMDTLAEMYNITQHNSLLYLIKDRSIQEMEKSITIQPIIVKFTLVR